MCSHVLEWLVQNVSYRMHITCLWSNFHVRRWRGCLLSYKKQGASVASRFCWEFIFFIFSETLNNFQPRWRYRVLIFFQDLATSLAVMVNEAGYFWREFRTSLAAFVVTESCIFNKTSWQILADIDIFGTSPAVCGDRNTFLSLFPDRVVLVPKPEVSTSTALSQDTT